MSALLRFVTQIIFLPCRQGHHDQCPGQANDYADANTKLTGPCKCSCACHKGKSQ